MPLTFADLILARFTLFQTARSGGIIYPVIRNIPVLDGSLPGETSIGKKKKKRHVLLVDAAAGDAPPPLPPAPAEAGRTENSKPKVLVADDDPQMRRLVRAVLERDGAQVIEAEDGLDALDLVGSNQFDLIVLDMDMPRLGGLGVLEELGASVATAQIPVIVLTARADETEARALDLGARDYLTKPIRPTTLAARVRAVLRRVKV